MFILLAKTKPLDSCSSLEPESGLTPRRTDGRSNLDLVFKGLRLCGLFPSNQRALNSRRFIVSGYVIRLARRQNNLYNEHLISIKASVFASIIHTARVCAVFNLFFEVIL
jgi:hypothetical protein